MHVLCESFSVRLVVLDNKTVTDKLKEVCIHNLFVFFFFTFQFNFESLAPILQFLLMNLAPPPLFNHFNSLSPNFRYTPTAGPLLSAPLLSWLKLALSIFTGSRHMPLYCNIKA